MIKSALDLEILCRLYWKLDTLSFTYYELLVRIILIIAQKHALLA